MVKNYLSMIPLAGSQVENIANAAVSLADEHSSYLTGSDLTADGVVVQV